MNNKHLLAFIVSPFVILLAACSGEEATPVTPAQVCRQVADLSKDYEMDEDSFKMCESNLAKTSKSKDLDYLSKQLLPGLKTIFSKYQGENENDEALKGEINAFISGTKKNMSDIALQVFVKYVLAPHINPVEPIGRSCLSTGTGEYCTEFKGKRHTGRYEFSEPNKCTTGEHVFKAKSADDVKKALCEALIDGVRNNHCAEDMRAQVFKVRCKERPTPDLD